MREAIERGWRAISAIEKQGLLDAFIEAAALESVKGEPAAALADLIGYTLDERGVLQHTHRSAITHAAASVSLFEVLEPMVFKTPFYEDAGLVLRLHRAPYFELVRIETHTPIDAQITSEFYKILPEVDRRICITEEQIYGLMATFSRALDIGLALHDFAFAAARNGYSFHYDEAFFQRHPLNPEDLRHQLLYSLAKEQKIATSEFSTLYGVLK